MQPGKDAPAPPHLAGGEAGAPERLDRDAARGALIDAEHLARYHWIAGAARGRRVLDAGCGTAYGTAILAGAGAARTVGVDRAADVLAQVGARMPDDVELEAADLVELPFEDDSFDLVTAFEVLEHLPDAEGALDELQRVLAPGGLLAVSSPNRDVYPPGNPHHLREYRPEELRDSLARRFASVALLRQHAWIASAMLDDEQLAAEDGAPLAGLAARKAAPLEPGAETYTVAIAAEGELPPLPPLVMLGPPLDQRWLQELIADRERLRAAQARAGETFDRVSAERDELRARLLEAEQAAADLPELNGLRAEVSAMRSSFSWRLTAPLRRLRAALVGSTLPAAARAAKRALRRAIARRGDDRQAR